jgi:hypothetical protein
MPMLERRLTDELIGLSGAILLAVIGWTIIFAVVPPAAQQFPLADDWVYSGALFGWWQGNGLHYFKSAVPVLGQWLWSLPFLIAFGPSHVTLRLSTVCASLAGTAGFYAIVRQAGAGRGIAAFAAAVWSLNPLVVLLSGTYMTEVPAVSFGLVALAAYGWCLGQGKSWGLTPFPQRYLQLRALRGKGAAAESAEKVSVPLPPKPYQHQTWGWALGAAFALLAVTTRQNMLAVPTAALIALLVRRPRWSAAAFLATVLPIVVGLVTEIWFRFQLDVVHPRMFGFVAVRAFLLIFIVIHTAGLAVLPLMALDPRPRDLKTFVLSLAALAASALYWTMRSELPFGGQDSDHGLFPYCTGVIGYGGPFTITMAGHMEAFLPHTIRVILTALGCLGGAWLLARIGTQLPAGLTNPIIIFALLQLPFLVLVRDIYDRYLFLILPTMVFLGVPRAPLGRWSIGFAGLVLVFFGVVSFALMHDCLAWNSARWSLGRRAVSRGVKPWQIDGGFEWNGWYQLQEPNQARPRPARSFVAPITRRNFPGVTGDLALVFWPAPPGQPTQFQIIDTEPYTQWLPPRRLSFYLMAADPNISLHSPS